MPDPPDLTAVYDAVDQFTRNLCGQEVLHVFFVWRDGTQCVLPRPAGHVPFVPSSFQRGILDALKGFALRTDALARKVGNRRKLFNKIGGLPELEAHGLVAHHPRLGYYSVRVPPPNLPADEINP